MSFTITIDWIINLLLTGLAISLAAFLLPFVYVRNFWSSVLIGLVIALFNFLIWAELESLGVNVAGSGSLGKTIINFLIFSGFLIPNKSSFWLPVQRRCRQATLPNRRSEERSIF